MKEITVIHVMSDDTKAFLRELLNEFKNDSKNTTEQVPVLTASSMLPLFDEAPKSGEVQKPLPKNRHNHYFAWQGGEIEIYAFREAILKHGRSLNDENKKIMANINSFRAFLKTINVPIIPPTEEYRASKIAPEHVIQLDRMFHFLRPQE